MSPLWLAQLFAILCISSQLGGAPADASLDKDLLLRCSAKSLVLGKYLKPQRYAVEALLLYVMCKYMSSFETVGEICTLLGVIVRLAMRMGYHRDAKQLSGINAFDGEMRRRTWAVIRHLDLLGSFQIGLPSLIQTDVCDAETPRNLVDSDFDEFTSQLPTPRSDTEATDMLYFVVKTRILKTSEEVVRISLSLQTTAYDEVIALDAQLRDVHCSIPPHMRRRPISQSFTDPTQLVLGRINCELLYQKSLCVLHRKCLRDDPENASSRGACTNAALTILEIQAELREESLPGGQLFRDRWMLSSITLHDFLLAATIICLDLSEKHKTDPSPLSSSNSEFDSKIGALKRSYAIFVEQSAGSKQARRCADAIAYMLPRIQNRLSKYDNPQDQVKTAGHNGELKHDLDVSRNTETLADARSSFKATDNFDWVSHLFRSAWSPLTNNTHWSYLVTFGSVPRPAQLDKLC